MSVFDKIKLDPSDAVVILLAVAKLAAKWPEVRAELRRIAEENEVIAPAYDAIEDVYTALTT